MATTPATDYAAITKYAGQYDKQLVSQMLNGLDFLSQVRTLRKASSHGVLLPKMTVNKGVRPLNLNVEVPKGTNRSFSGRKLFVYGGMKIITIIPEEARQTFMDEMLDPNAKEIPFAQWVWAREMEKISQEINDNIYLSKYKADAAAWLAGSTYTGGTTDYVNFEESIYRCVTTTTAGQSPTTHPAKWAEVDDTVISQGWGTILANEINAGTISGANLISTGAISNTNALTKLELMYKGMTVAHRNIGGTFRVSSDVMRAYLEHERTTYGNAASPDFGDGKKYIYGSGKKWEIQECTWMGASGRVIATQKDNLVFGTNMESDYNKIGKSVETLHGTKSIVKWLQGCEISDLETLYVNDQA
jgi:hypothetical protein